MKMKLTSWVMTGALGVVLSASGCAGAASPGSETGPPPPGGPAEGVTAGAMGFDQGHYESVLEMLRGRVPGLEILEISAGQIEVRIRGVNQSLQTNAAGASVGQQPLVVVDGVPRSRPAGEVLLSLDPRDVASIDVLKDVSSTSIYGTKGANGVIIVRLTRRD